MGKREVIEDLTAHEELPGFIHWFTDHCCTVGVHHWRYVPCYTWVNKKKKLRQRLMGQKFIRLSKIESIWLHTCWPSATEELHAWGLVQVICGAESSVDFFWDTCSREKCMIKNYRFKLFSVQISAFLLEV